MKPAAAAVSALWLCVRGIVTPTLPYMHLANTNFWQNMEKAPPTLPYMHLAK